ncbi:MAG: TetR/AcrR family transcriptional regulator [Euryarchaeota archaeon]|nr:TetR/AcrR family transcriptional regulator [Euryarchaeota archaeon]
MSRNRAGPDGRRSEFINAAEALFSEKGFESTSVEDIVERVGVAKGLFYYYFESKEMLMTAMVAKMTDEIESNIKDIMSEEGLTAMERFDEILTSNKMMKERSRELMKWFHEERNQALHFSMEEKGTDHMLPALESIIRQGIEEGVFETPYPRESAIAMLSIFRGISHDKMKLDEPVNAAYAAKVLGHLTERILGAEEGTFSSLRKHLPEHARKGPHVILSRS